jgi:hypothetical protein
VKPPKSVNIPGGKGGGSKKALLHSDLIIVPNGKGYHLKPAVTHEDYVRVCAQRDEANASRARLFKHLEAEEADHNATTDELINLKKDYRLLAWCFALSHAIYLSKLLGWW